jgi:hypothetical protein
MANNVITAMTVPAAVAMTLSLMDIPQRNATKSSALMKSEAACAASLALSVWLVIL